MTDHYMQLLEEKNRALHDENERLQQMRDRIQAVLDARLSHNGWCSCCDNIRRALSPTGGSAATIEWGLVTCPDHRDQGAVLHGRQEAISEARAGCTACRITLTCTECGWATRHVLWASATSAEAHHERSCDPNRSSTW